MANNWDRFDTQDEFPFFTGEERKRISRVHDELQKKYDPVLYKEMRRRPVHFRKSREVYEANVKVRDAERAAGQNKGGGYR